MCTVDGEFGIYSNAMCRRGLFPFFPVLIQAIAVDSYLAATHSFLLGRGLSLRFFLGLSAMALMTPSQRDQHGRFGAGQLFFLYDFFLCCW
jgi:hypothetical protein